MMENLQKNNEEACSKLQDLLEESAALRDARSIEELAATLGEGQRAHLMACATCREAAQDILDAREIFRDVPSQAAVERPWFATRVMAVISARERQLKETASTWLAVPKFAARLAMAAGAVLLVGSTWLYRSPAKVSPAQPSATASQEYLFDPPPAQASQDDVLISMAEQNQ
jgi:hypothetical protein